MTKMSQNVADAMMKSLGITRYRAKLNKAKLKGIESYTEEGVILMRDAVVEVGNAIEAWLKSSISRPGKNHDSAKFLVKVPAKTVSLIACRVLLDKLSENRPYLSVASAIGSAIESEAKLLSAKKDFPDEFNEILFHVNALPNQNFHKRAIITKDVTKNIKKFYWDKWDLKDRYKIGAVLIEAFAGCTNIIDTGTPYVYSPNGPRRKSIISPTPEVRKWLKRSREENEVRFPFYLPTVEPPEDWVSQWRGGYSLNVFLRWPLVKVRDSHLKKLTKKQMPEVYKAVNIAQKTAWRINTDVFSMFDYYWTSGIEIAGLPSRDLCLDMVEPHDIATNEIARKEYRRALSKLKVKAKEQEGIQILTSKIHYVANQYQEQHFYYPYKMDFRGRIYPIPSFLTPQGNDLSKGLLQFADGMTINSEEAYNWYMVHGANCFSGPCQATASRSQILDAIKYRRQKLEE